MLAFHYVCVCIGVFLCMSHHAIGLDPCDKAVSKLFLSKAQLRQNILDLFCGSEFWSPLTATYEYEEATEPGKYAYSPKDNNACNVTYTKFAENGSQVLQNSRIAADVIDNKYLGYIITGAMSATYAFKCSEHLLLLYRCEMAWQSGGPTFQIFAPWDKFKADLSQELSSCTQTMKAINSSIVLVESKHPDL